MADADLRTVGALGRAMVRRGVLSEHEAIAIQSQAQQASTGFVDQVLRANKMNAMQLATFASQAFGLPLLDLNGFDLQLIKKEWVDPKIVERHKVLPLYRQVNRLFVAVSDPTNAIALEAVQFRTSHVIEPIVVEHDKLSAAIAKVIDDSGHNIDTLPGAEVFEIELVGGAPEPDEQNQEVEDAPVVRYVNKVLLDAIAAGVSDIHFEPFEKFYRVRYRLDGILKEVGRPPLAIKDKIASRIKVVAKLDIAEKRVPQDGRMKLVLSKSRSIDFRVSTLPSLYGEKIVLRILDSAGVKLGIDALGYETDQRKILLDAIARPYGMILVTGPTGSGKTVSLYTCLNILNQPNVNISTAEDPAEIQLPGVIQVNVNEKAGLTFANSLRAFLRQDPDIIMVGEIRDLETADIAIKAAQTGHLVLSTLHTNDAPATLMRLANMGVPAFNIASSVILITAQRLCRKLCTLCKRAEEIPPEALLQAGFAEADLDGSWQAYGPVGCEACLDTGYKGRMGIYEVMPITDEMRQIIMRNGNVIDIAAQARKEGVRNLRQSGLLKVKQGTTSLEEIEAVTNV